MKLLRAALCLAALAWGTAGAQTFNPLAPYGTIWDTSPQLCVQGGNNFVCGTGALVTGSIASYVYTTNGAPANLAYLNPSTLVGNPTANFTQAVPITLGTGLSFSGTTLNATGSGSFTPINLQAQGACGITDGTTIFNAAATAAASSGQALYIPGGCTVNHTGTLTLTSLSLLGDGPTSILNATDTTTTPHSALLLAGTNPLVQGINFQTTWTTGGRSTQIYSSAVATTGVVTNAKVLNNWITSAFAGTGIEISYGVTGAEIGGNIITGNVKANPMIFQATTSLPISNFDIHDNYVTGGGDNCIEMVDYSHSAYSLATQLKAHDNRLYSCGAAGVAMLGIADSSDESNLVVNAVGRSHYIASEVGSTESPVNNVTVSGNIDYGSTASDSDIFIWGSQVSGSYFVSDIIVANNQLHLTGGNNGVYVDNCSGCATPTVFRPLISGNSILGNTTASSDGIVIAGGAQDVTISGNSITGFQQAALILFNTNAGNLKIIGNHTGNLSNVGAASYPVFDLNSSTFAAMQVIGNDYTAGTVAVGNLVTCNTSTPLLMSGNVGSANNSSSGCTEVAVTSGLGTSPSVNGSASLPYSFVLTTSSTGSPSATIVLAMPNIGNTVWNCTAWDQTTAAKNPIYQGAGTQSATVVTLTATAAPATSDKIPVNCTPN